MSKMPPSRERAKHLFAETVEVVTGPETVQVVAAPAPKSQVQPKAQASPLALPVAFDGGTPINTSFGVGRPKRPPALNKDGRRRAGDYVLGAVRIKAETASRPGDFLNGSDNRLAASWLEAVTRPIEAEVPTVMGGELSLIGEEASTADNALACLKNTVDDPNYITADASRDRIQLAHDAGALELGLDLAATIQAENSLEKLLAHQLAANHRSIMKLTAQLNRCTENMENIYNPDAQERANLQGTRLAGAIARMQSSFQAGITTLQKMRTGGQQTVRVVHQYVQVNEGAQAVVAGEMNAGKPMQGRGRKRVGGRSENA